MVEIAIRTVIYPTEDEAKVRQAVLAIFPDADISVHEGTLTASSHSLGRLKELLMEARIRDAARAKILHGKQGEMTEFWINKQVAFAGKVNFVGPNQEPLGSIAVRISAPDLGQLIDDIAPSTRRSLEVP